MVKVIVIEPPNKDISKARQFGELVCLFPAGDRRPSIFETTEFVNAMRLRLLDVDFDPKHDYLLAVGPSIPVNLAFNLFAKVYGTFNVLFHHATVQEYVPRTLYKDTHYERRA